MLAVYVLDIDIRFDENVLFDGRAFRHEVVATILWIFNNVVLLFEENSAEFKVFSKMRHRMVIKLFLKVLLYLGFKRRQSFPIFVPCALAWVLLFGECVELVINWLDCTLNLIDTILRHFLEVCWEIRGEFVWIWLFVRRHLFGLELAWLSILLLFLHFQGNGYVEFTPLTLFTLDAHGAAHLLDDVLANRKSQTCSLGVHTLMFVKPGVVSKQFLLVFLGYSCPIVFNCDLGLDILHFGFGVVDKGLGTDLVQGTLSLHR